MALDQTANFVRQSVTSSVGTTDPETIDVSDASAFPDPSGDTIMSSSGIPTRAGPTRTRASRSSA